MKPTLRTAGDGDSTARWVAKNALVNADFPRLLVLLEQMGVDLESADPVPDPPAVIRYSTPS